MADELGFDRKRETERKRAGGELMGASEEGEGGADDTGGLIPQEQAGMEEVARLRRQRPVHGQKARRKKKEGKEKTFCRKPPGF